MNIRLTIVTVLFVLSLVTSFSKNCFASDMIEVSIEITEINNNKSNDLGIRWTDTIQGGELSWTPSFAGTARVPATLPEVPSLIDAGDWKRYTALTATLQVLESKGAAQVLSKPKIVTRSGTSADFLVGGEIPIVASGVGGGSINWKEYGLKMVILPRIMQNGQIDVSLTTEVSRLDWANAVAGNPAITSRKATSQLTIKNGQTFTLAGMIETKKEKQKTGIPLLMDIPVLGYLFSHQSIVETKSNILIFVTPKILD
jgi:pilus assembly protein CpaC